MKKILLILFSVFIITGCTAHYELKINDDLSIEETIIGLESDEFYNNYFNSSKERVVDFVMATQMDYLKENKYDIKNITKDLMYGSKVTKKYANLDEFHSNSIAYKQFYKSFNLTDKDGIIEINLSDKMGKNAQDPTRYVIDEGTVNIIVPFKVLEHNADNVDLSNNKYTWYVNSSNDKTIYIKLDSNKKANNGDLYIILGSLLLIGLLTYIIIQKYKKSQLVKDKI